MCEQKQRLNERIRGKKNEKKHEKNDLAGGGGRHNENTMRKQKNEKKNDFCWSSTNKTGLAGMFGCFTTQIKGRTRIGGEWGTKNKKPDDAF